MMHQNNSSSPYKVQLFSGKVAVGAIAAFLTYSCMYAFRKPFTVATFDGYLFLGMHYKVWMIITQLSGYTLSKFYGIKFISESVSKNKARYIILFILISWFSLFLFAVIPPPFNLFFMFMNGFPLGMIWGLVFSYLEGRRTTELWGALLCTSFIFSTGFVKTIGSYLLLNFSISEWWMPFLTGALFIPLLILSVWILNQIPPPTIKDINFRSKRNPMNKDERKNLLFKFFPGIITLVIVYVFLTIARDLRDNFSAEIWKENNILSPVIFSKTETPISLIILVIMASIMFIRNNKKALIINHAIIVTGFLFTLVSTYLFYFGQLNTTNWMIFSGLGLYMGYVPFNCILFDRLISCSDTNGTSGFLIYIADSFGYLGSFCVVLFKEFFSINIKWTSFLTEYLAISSLIAILMISLSLFYFKRSLS